MIESLRSWIVSICTAVLFITAIEIILPDNKLKKYAKFVLGLILITVLIKPIVRIFDKNYNINTYAQNAEKVFEQDYKNNYNKLKAKNTDNTLKAFQLNLKTICESKLKEKFPKDNYVVDVDAAYAEETGTFEIRSIKIEVHDKRIKSIKKVIIDKNSAGVNDKQMVDNKLSNSIKELLSNELGVSKDIIAVYKN